MQAYLLLSLCNAAVAKCRPALPWHQSHWSHWVGNAVAGQPWLILNPTSNPWCRPVGPLVREQGVLTRLGAGYSCDPLQRTGQSCVSEKYKTQFALNATGVLRLTAADAKKPVQLLLTATGRARVTLNGAVLPALDINSELEWQFVHHIYLPLWESSLLVKAALRTRARLCRPAYTAATTAGTTKTASMTLPAGDARISVEVRGSNAACAGVCQLACCSAGACGWSGGRPPRVVGLLGCPLPSQCFPPICQRDRFPSNLRAA